MTDDLSAQFSQLQQYTSALHELMTAAQSHAPTHSTGADRTGAVRVTIDHDGLPESFRVENDWDRRIEPDSFGVAVMDAFHAAIGDRMQKWSQVLTDDGWRDCADRLRQGQPTGRIPAAFRKPAPVERPRPVGVVAEDVFKAFDGVTAVAKTPENTTASGSDLSGKLTITLSKTGMTAVTADQRWTADQTAARLMNALGQALQTAKQELRTQPAAAVPSDGLDGLLAEVMTILGDPRHLAD
ncbi:hypothetical protein [Actinocrispum sp. NPDC049592]|uniref:hypothetical protein n=1 Tax=Actinocrispum sp. NPDC049592 TaxID=3154835 RepID=UPI00342E2A23